MDRIDPLAGFFPFRKPEKKKTKERAELLNFSAKLESIQQREEEELAAELNGEAAYKGNLEDHLDRVHEQGERLKYLPTVENVQKYRKAVSSFLKYAFARMFSVEKNISGVNILKRKYFTRVKVIDRKIERLVADILQNQAAQLDLIARVDEINGLLIDLSI
ncbi:hypothetical protein ES708_19014 [subsurface metagenome]